MCVLLGTIVKDSDANVSGNGETGACVCQAPEIVCALFHSSLKVILKTDSIASLFNIP